MKAFLEYALRPSIRHRAIRVALVVGSIFFLLNYTDRLIAGTMLPQDFLKAALSYCIPYCVSTYSSVLAILEGERA